MDRMETLSVMSKIDEGLISEKARDIFISTRKR